MLSTLTAPVCECNCRAFDNSICTKNGDSGAENVCGACECDQKQGEDTFLHKISSWLLTSVLYLGDFCQCSKDGGDSNQELEERCEAGGRVCSGHGTCDCGVCLCKSSKLRPEHFLYNGCLKSSSPNEAMSSM